MGLPMEPRASLSPLKEFLVTSPSRNPPLGLLQGLPPQKSFKGLLAWDSYPVEFDGIKLSKGLLLESRINNILWLELKKNIVRS